MQAQDHDYGLALWINGTAVNQCEVEIPGAGCHSQGRTKEEAVANIKEAIEGYIVSMRELGEDIF